ncbi:MAG: CopG family transcriptional regulator [Verrucomicrobia bacterium]|jgi:predicted transcriptional regulator|nr:CopG family transcriptional regulator [Verrucomicrobiota bacterium]
MPKQPKQSHVKTTPLSFEIDADLADSLEKLRRQLGNVSISKLIDHAIERFDYKKISRKAGGERKQLSVRLSDDKRGVLDKLSKSEKVSMAYLIRHALESLMDSAQKKTVQAQLKKALASAAPPPAKKTAGKKRAAKKAGTKKKAAGKKRAAKKAATKKRPAKKAATKKRPAKKAATKKRPAKKAATKKRAVKKAATKKRPAKKAARKAVVKKKVPSKKAVARKASRKRVAKKARR